MHKFQPHHAAGILVFVLGLVVIAGWWTNQPRLVYLVPDFLPMMFHVALCFVIAGAALLLPQSRLLLWQRGQQAAGILLLGLAGSSGLQYLSGIDFGIDPNPGRMPPLTSVGFMFAGGCFLLMHRLGTSRFAQAALQMLILGIIAVGIFSLVGFTLKLQLLYSWYQFARMAPQTAFGLIVLGAGLWGLWFGTLKRSGVYTHREDKRIAALATLILFVLAFTGGLTGFALSTQRTEASLKQGLQATLANRTQLLESVIGDMVKLSSALATDPALLEALQRPAGRPGNLRNVEQRFAGIGFAGMSVISADGNVRMQHGDFETRPRLALSLQQGATLLWSGHIDLQVTVPVVGNGKRLGTLVLQRALPTIDKMLADARLLGATGDIIICASGGGDRIRCLPSRLVPQGFPSISRLSNGKPWPVTRALGGESGVTAVNDGRGTPVIAAFGPVPGFGLGVVVKQDTTELFAPIRAQLTNLLILLTALVASSLVLMRSQLLPLVSSLLNAKREADINEAKMRSVVENVADGLITINDKGTILSFNPAAATMFGHRPSEVIGQDVGILVPERLKVAHGGRMARLARRGKATIAGGPGVEVLGLRKDGSEFPMQVAIREMRMEGERSFVGIVRDISERRQAEYEMRMAEERFRLFSQATNDVVWDLDFATGETWWNEAVAPLLGYPAGTVHGGSEWWKSRVHPDDIGELLRHIEGEIAAGCQSWAVEYRFARADGTYIDIHDRAYVMRDGAGNPVRALGAMMDITERKQAEAKLRQTKARFSNVFNLSPVPITITRVSDGRFLDANDAMLDMLGYQRDEMIGHTSMALRFWYTPDERAALVERVLRDGSVRDQPVKGRNKAGQLLDLLISMDVVDLAGEPHLFCFLANVTERKRAEEALRESEEKFRSIVETTKDWIWQIDAQGLARYANPAVEEILGYKPEELLGTSMLQHMHEEQRAALAEDLARLVDEKGAWTNLVIRWRHKDGSDRYTQSSAVPVLSDSGELIGYRGSDHDITLLKRYEQELEEARQKAEAANQAKSEFLANMSHEIRTPMNGVIGLTGLMLDTELTARQREYLDLMKSSADSLLRLLNDILDFSKMEARKLELDVIGFDVREAVGNTLKTFAASASEKGVELAFHVAPQVPAVLLGDPGRLAQILVNLVGNALKFTRAGEVVVRLGARPRGHTTLLDITVADSGIGMTAEQLNKVFAAFAQGDSSTTRQYGGTGLGLSIVSQLVALMDGSIRVESEPGKGTTFHLAVRLGLPERQPLTETGQQALALSAARPRASQDARPLRPPPARKLNVLVAEDHPVNQVLVGAILSGRGHTYSIAANGLEVLRQLEGEPAGQPFDVILMDCQMPEMDGYQATREIRRRERITGRHLHIIAVTANAMNDDRARCDAAGMDDYMSKPVDAGGLLERLEAAPAPAPAPAPVAVPRAFDADEALKRARGKLPLLKQLAQLFLDDLPASLTSLQAAVAAADPRAIERHAHRLRGAAFTVCAEPLAAAANRLELIGRNDELASLPHAAQEVQQRAAELAAELDAFMEE